MASKYFAVVDEYVSDPTDPNGAVRVREPAYRDSIVCVKRNAHTGPDGVFYPEVCRSCDCSVDGIYFISESDEFYEQKLKVMTAFAKKLGKFVGPFDSRAQAKLEAEKVRPKSEVELLREKVARLESEAQQNVQTTEKKLK